MKENTLIEFYTRVLASIGASCSEDGYIYVGRGVDKIMVIVDGKPLVLPTKEHINSLLDKNEQGEITVIKIPYNPLNENVVKGNTLSLMRTKILIERAIAHYIAAAGELLLTIASRPELQKKTNLEINKFLASTNAAKNPGITKLVDDKSVAIWGKIYENSLLSDKNMASVFLKKSGNYKNVKYNRLAVLGLPVYEMLKEATTETPVFNTRLRNKDLTVFKLIFDFLIEDKDENDTISVGSNDPESPAFISLFKLYIRVMTRIAGVIEMLRNVNQETADTAYVNLSVTEAELDELNMYKSELMLLPDEHDINRSSIAASAIKNIPVNDAIFNKNVGSLQTGIIPAQQTYQQQTPQYNVQQPVQAMQPMQLEATMTDDPVKRILMGNGIPVVPSMTKGQRPVNQYVNPNMPMGYQGQPQYNYQQPQQHMMPGQPMMPDALPMMPNNMNYGQPQMQYPQQQMPYQNQQYNYPAHPMVPNAMPYQQQMPYPGQPYNFQQQNGIMPGQPIVIR